MFANKSIVVSGNLKNLKLGYRLCPSTEFSAGLWNVTVSSLCCEARVDIDAFCTITSNFCVSKKYSSNGQVETYQEPFGTFHIQVRSGKKQMITNTNPIWLEMNRLSGTKFKNIS